MNRIGLVSGLFLLGALTAAPVRAQFENGGQCAPFARKMSGVQIYGDAWTWWGQAAGRYERGSRPKVAAVLVFRPSGRMKLGHVAAISRVISNRIAMVTHSNWSTIDGERELVERDVTLVDVSANNDWSLVRVWYDSVGGLGGSTYPTYGFIYGTPDPDARDHIARARPAANLSGPSPDIVGAVIDSLASR